MAPRVLSTPTGPSPQALWEPANHGHCSRCCAPVGAAPPPVRHGICRLTLRIGGTDYRLRPMPAPPGFRAVWVLRKLDPHGEAAYSVAAPKGKPAGCTCPDHEHNGLTCKHIMALPAARPHPRPKAARPRPSPARARQFHAKNARQAIAEAKALARRGRRHLAEIAPARPSPARGMAARRRSRASFAAGFRQAVPPTSPASAAAVTKSAMAAGGNSTSRSAAIPNFCESCVRRRR